MDRTDTVSLPAGQSDLGTVVAPLRGSTLTAPGGLEIRGNGRDAMSAASRLAVAGVVLVTLLVAGIASSFGLAALQGPSVTIFLLIELGAAPWLLFGRMSAMWFSLLAISTSLAGTVAIGFAMAATHLWHPSVAMLIVVLVTLALLVHSVVRDYREVRALKESRVGSAPTVGSAPSAPTASLTARIAIGRIAAARANPAFHVSGLTILGLIVIVIVALTHQTSPQPAGLFQTLGLGWYVGLLLIVGAAVWAKRCATSPALPVLCLAGVVVLSQALVYGSPAVMSAARHVGIVDYIRVNHGIDASLDIYQAWSGLFAGVAWLCDVGNISDAMSVATWWPVLLSAGIALATAALASRFIRDRYRIWFAAAVFTLTSTLNVIYFSPQSLGIFLALVIFALAVEARRNPMRSRPRGGGVTFRVSPGLFRLGLIFFFACVMAVTHQISPYLTVAALAVLWLFGFVRPWWLLIVVIAPALGWAVANSDVLGNFISLGAVGRLWDNVQPPSHSFAQLPTPAVTRLAFDVPAALLVVVGVLALVTLLVMRSRIAGALAIAALSPASLFLATDYGQEGIFRVTLFATPWLAVLVAALPTEWLPLSWLRSTIQRWALPVLSSALVVMLAVNVYGQTALDWNRVISPDLSRATQTYEAVAPDKAVMLLTGTANATPQGISARYLDVQYISRENFGDYPASSGSYNAPADVVTMTRELEDYAPTASRYYALVSVATGAYDARYGYQTYADYQELAKAMAASSLWTKVLGGPTSTLYMLRNAGSVAASK